MLNKTTKLLMMLAVLVLTAGIIPPPPSGNVAWSKKPKDPGQGTSGLFVRADFQTAITETGTGEPAEPADMLSDLEGSVVAPVVMSPCRGPYDFWDSRFDTVCTDLSSGSVSSSVSSGGRWQMFTRIGGDTSTLTNNRWFVFNFTVSPDGDPCPNLDSLLYSGPAGDLFQPPSTQTPVSTT